MDKFHAFFETLRSNGQISCSSLYFLTEIIFYKPQLTLFFQAPMTPQKLLHFAEFSFQQIGRIRDTQVGKTLAGKQPWQMPFQAVVGGAQALMRVV